MRLYHVKTMTIANEIYTTSVKLTKAEKYVSKNSILIAYYYLSFFLLKTALQVYCRAYKQVSLNHGHGLLRKARRLDSILNIRNEVPTPQVPAPSSAEPQCHQCHTEFSPAFYPLAESPSMAKGQQNDLNKWECHRCHFEANETSKKVEEDKRLDLESLQTLNGES